MPRTSDGPCYYKSKRAWFANLGGERILLVRGPKKETEEEAGTRYREEVESRRVETEGDRNTVWAVLNAYLADLESRVKNEEMAENTVQMRRQAIVPFNEMYGAMRVRDLRPQHVNDFLAHMRQPRSHKGKGQAARKVSWGAATAKLARNALRSAFLWAVEVAGLISKTPFDRKGRGRPERRHRRRPSEGRTAITDGEHRLLLGQAMKRSKKDFAYLLTFLYGTGARPAEMHQATAEEWDEERKAFVIKAAPSERGRYKLAHLGEDRVVYVPESLVPLARDLMAKYPTGPIFRTGSGRPWTVPTICARFTSSKKAVNAAAIAKGEEPPVRKAVTAYSYRHAYVTRWVEEGRHLWKLCELLNTSEAMVRQHYSHLFQRTEALREALEGFDRGRAGPPATSPAYLPGAAVPPAS
jgi:integrase